MIAPQRAFYRPGEPVNIAVPGPFRATIWHLADIVAKLNGEDCLRWTPPAEIHRGYRVYVETVAGATWTAFDVLNQWTDAPRYGYLVNFKPDRASFDLDWLLSMHVNGLQFYDWLYRHDTLLPPSDEFLDPLGRPQSLTTVRRLIGEAHARGMAAMPYTAIYAASPPFAAAHPGWGLYDEHGVIYDFADGFLKYMNPASGWSAHLARQCASLVQALPFDGIHLDQYGEPFTGYDASGQNVKLPAALRGAIEQVRAAVPPSEAVLFNLVHNWPLDAIAPAPLDFLYCELWPPMTTLGDLARVAEENRSASHGRIPVIAAYILPERETTVKMAQAVMLASGASHIAHGEDGLYLSDPYFPKAGRPSPELAAQLKRLADFGVAYEELLGFAAPAIWETELTAPLWVIHRRTTRNLVAHLINAAPDEMWTSSLSEREPQNDVRLAMNVDGSVARIWCATPDHEAPPEPLSFTQDGERVMTIVPRVETWTMVCIELA